MCGVVGSVGGEFNVESALDSIVHRGPDARGVVRSDRWQLGHARLSIVDLDSRSDQPFCRGDVTLSFNGEVWNYRQLRSELEEAGSVFRTESDTEVLAAALERWGEGALSRLNGMFAFAWVAADGVVRLARDRFGEVPMHAAPLRGGGWCFASELKAIPKVSRRHARWVRPGEVWSFRGGEPEVKAWYSLSCAPGHPVGIEEASIEVRRLLGIGCDERGMSDVPVCTLLSGGVDSSAIAALLKPRFPNLVAFTAVMDQRSPDLWRARAVAESLSLPLVEVSVPSPSADDLERVVDRIELPHKAQVEIAWACEKLADAMRSEGFKVTFSGEGSDELWGAYGFARYSIAEKGWHAARRELFLSQHRKNFPRCNKVFMSQSIECRLPFLSPGIVEYAMGLSQDAVRGEIGASRDVPSSRKLIMARAFEGMLPPGIAARPRLAFQAGLGLREKVEEVVSNPRRFYEAVWKTKFGGEP
jgi:asparagine synthase (glutamine-hydrolysing)